MQLNIWLLYAKEENCKFHVMQVFLLGYVIMEQNKVAPVRKWPTTVKEPQCSMGFAFFYSSFIHGFRTIANPLTALLNKAPEELC